MGRKPKIASNSMENAVKEYSKRKKIDSEQSIVQPTKKTAASDDANGKPIPIPTKPAPVAKHAQSSSSSAPTSATTSGPKDPVSQVNLTPKPIVVLSTLQTVINYIKQSNVATKDVSITSINREGEQKKVNIQCSSMDVKNKIIETLKTHQLRYHSYTENSNKKSVFVLKGYDLDQNQNEILEELKAHDIPATNVTTIVQSSENRKAVHLVSFEKDAISISQLNHLHRVISCIRVSWEVQLNKNKRTTQCHNCQRWGHSSFNCGHAPRCIKCGNEHKTENCLRPTKNELKSEDPPKCANCGGEHTANYRKCEAAKKYLQSVKPKTVHQAQRSPQNSKPVPWKTSSAPEYKQMFPPIQQNRPMFLPIQQTRQIATASRPSAQRRLDAARRQPDINTERRASESSDEDLEMDQVPPNNVSYSTITKLSNRFTEIMSYPGFYQFLETFFSMFMKMQSAQTADEKNIMFAESCSSMFDNVP